IGSIREIARLLVSADNPRITAGRVARTQKGIDLLVELADLVQCPVNATGDRVSFPSRHPLAGPGAPGSVDFTLILASGSAGAGGAGGRGARGGPGNANGRISAASITSAEFLATHNYNINGAGAGQADLMIAADAEATLPGLIEEVRKLITTERRRVFDERGA